MAFKIINKFTKSNQQLKYYVYDKHIGIAWHTTLALGTLAGNSRNTLKHAKQFSRCLRK